MSAINPLAARVHAAALKALGEGPDQVFLARHRGQECVNPLAFAGRRIFGAHYVARFYTDASPAKSALRQPVQEWSVVRFPTPLPGLFPPSCGYAGLCTRLDALLRTALSGGAPAFATLEEGIALCEPTLPSATHAAQLMLLRQSLAPDNLTGLLDIHHDLHENPFPGSGTRLANLHPRLARALALYGQLIDAAGNEVHLDGALAPLDDGLSAARRAAPGYYPHARAEHIPLTLARGPGVKTLGEVERG